ncbi:kinase-like protein [Macrolepiota fuliginosa MF-IS2]|uniref:Kinase-like protein n=1 Tax=Macrolepiota fuliginosa MF-IS2 TaxID=1400762 RepID=A0A9P5XHG2_9AGAR|nr:kinase-like protein [Macrolepiota fuliginosa MF-IS2]
MSFFFASYLIGRSSCFWKVLRESSTILTTGEQRRTLSTLCKLAKKASVFPRCYELKGIQYSPRLLDGGSFGDVYKGEYKNQVICVKAIRMFERSLRQPLVKHARELILWAFLSHQNILPFYGAYIDQNSQRLCFISPWMDNSNLCNYLETHPGSPRNILVFDIINGLNYLHEESIVHGDLKGKNVLISDDGRALIADFGISNITMSTRHTTSSKGTIRWCAPELFDPGEEDSEGCDGTPTRESDIWSFSCVCYEVFTRKVPFYQYHRDPVVMHVLMKGIEVPTRPASHGLDSVDDSMWDIMKKCWNYTPKERPACSELLQLILEHSKSPGSHQQAQTEDGQAYWKVQKAESNEDFNYQGACQILTRIQQGI